MVSLSDYLLPSSRFHDEEGRARGRSTNEASICVTAAQFSTSRERRSSENSPEPITDFNPTCLANSAPLIFAAFAADFLYCQRAAGKRDGDFFSADGSDLAPPGAVLCQLSAPKMRTILPL